MNFNDYFYAVREAYQDIKRARNEVERDAAELRYEIALARYNRIMKGTHSKH